MFVGVESARERVLRELGRDRTAEDTVDIQDPVVVEIREFQSQLQYCYSYQSFIPQNRNSTTTRMGWLTSKKFPIRIYSIL